MFAAQRLFVFGCILMGGSWAAVLPTYIQVCHRSDPNLNNCIKKCVENLQSRMHSGIPQLYIPPLEPLRVPEVKLDQDSGTVYIHSTYKNIEVHGLSKFKVKEVDADTVNDRLMMKLHFPEVRMKADYSLTGKIMMMPLLGEGPCVANLSEVSVVANIGGNRYDRNGAEHLRIEDIKITYDIGDINVQFENLFNGDSVLGNKMNQFLNENWRDVSEEIRPIMEDAMAEVLQKITGKLFELYTYEQLLPN